MLLGNFDEIHRRNETEFGVDPARQCLKPANAVAAHADDRLEMHVDGFAGNGARQQRLDGGAAFTLQLDLRRMDHDLAIAGLLGGIERGQCLMQHGIGVSRLVAGDADADAGRYAGDTPAEIIGRGEQFCDNPAIVADLFGIGQAGQQKGEHVAAQACGIGIMAQRRAQACRDLAKDRVARSFAEKVVDRAKATQVEHRDRKTGIIMVCQAQLALDPGQKTGMVAQPG